MYPHRYPETYCGCLWPQNSVSDFKKLQLLRDKFLEIFARILRPEDVTVCCWNLVMMIQLV